MSYSILENICMFIITILITPIFKRLHLVELHDLSFFPTEFRNLVTDILASIWCVKIPIIMPVSRAEYASNLIANATGYMVEGRILDLCSGGGGPIKSLVKQNCLNRIQFTLSDLFPNIKTFKQVSKNSQGRICYEPNPIDATNVPNELSNKHMMRTLHASFHHLTPNLATKILNDCVNKNQPIMILEIQQRSLWVLFLFAIGIVPFVYIEGIKLCKQYIKNGNWQRILWLPFVGPIFFFDGIVSAIRTYSEDEFLELAKNADKNNEFDWKVETHFVDIFSPLITYTGKPKKKTKKM